MGRKTSPLERLKSGFHHGPFTRLKSLLRDADSDPRRRTRRRQSQSAWIEPLERRTLLSAVSLSRSALLDGDSSLSITDGRVQQRISEDGRFVVFTGEVSTPTECDPAATTTRAFLHDRVAGTTTQIAGGSGRTFNPVISADGNFVVFESDAGDLVAGDNNSATDVFLFDRQAGTITLVSRAAAVAGTADAASFAPTISDDGRFVAFSSNAADLVAGITDTNGTTDVFLFDRLTGTVQLVSSASGAPANGTSDNAQISGDGNWIVYESNAADLTANDGNALYDVFLFDRSTGTTTLVSTNQTGSGNGHSFNAVISADGGVVALESYATDLTENDTNGATGDVFLYQRATGTLTLVSRNAAGTGSGNRDSWDPHLSADGSVLVFESFADDLTNHIDTNAQVDVFLYDVTLGTLTLVSAAQGGQAADNEASYDPSLSRDGRFVVFESFAKTLIPEGEDENDTVDVYLFDRLAGAPGLLSANLGATKAANGDSWDPQISGDGSFVVFTSTASDLVAGALPADVNVYGLSTIPELRFEDLEQVESNGASTFQFVVRRSHSGTNATARYRTHGGTAEAGSDFTAVSSALLDFAAGGSLKTTADVQITGDEIVELDESFLVELFNLSGATIPQSLSFATGRIKNDDSGKFEVLDLSQVEGTGGSGSFVVTVRLSHAVQGTVSVGYSTANGTATAGEDYVSASGTLTFAATSPGDTRTFMIPVATDSWVEEHETFTVKLAGSSHVYVTGDDTGTITINNDDRRTLAVGADAGGGPHVRVFDASTGQEQFGFFAYDPGFTGGVRVAMGDITGDGVADIITAPGTGGGPHIRVFDGQTGALAREFFAYVPDFLGGVFVASADVNNDGRADIITGADAGGGPHVKVFSGTDGTELHSFFAYDSNFRGGVRVAAADFTGEGHADIVTAAGPGGGPHVRVFDGNTSTPLSNPAHNFFAYDPGFAGGVFIAVTQRTREAIPDIITGAGPGGSPHVRVFSGFSGSELLSFHAYDPDFTGGVRVAAARLYSNGVPFVVTAPGTGSSAEIRLFNPSNLDAPLSLDGFDPAFHGGAFVAGAGVVAADAGGLPGDGDFGSVIDFKPPYNPLPDTNFEPGEFDPWFPVGTPLEAANGVPQSDRTIAELSATEPQPIVTAATARLERAGVPAPVLAEMSDVEIDIKDLVDAMLSASEGGPAVVSFEGGPAAVLNPAGSVSNPATGLIYVDTTAAGYGWFVDPTPDADEEFLWRPTTGWRAVSPHAIRGIDLLSAVLYELGHQAGAIDLDPAGNLRHWMAAALQPGRRRLPTPENLDEVFTNADWLN